MLKELSINPQFKVFIKNKYILPCVIFSLLLNILIWLLLYLKIGNQTESIALHYNIYFGIDMIGSWYKILMIPLGGIIILIYNWIISYFIYKQNNENIFLGYLLNFSSLFIHIILIISSILILIINS